MTLLLWLTAFYGIDVQIPSLSKAPVFENHQLVASLHTAGVREKVGRKAWPGPCETVPRHCLNIVKSAKNHRLDPFLWTAVIMLESQGDERARGTSGEYGLSQLMPVHVKHLNYEQRFDPETNLGIGAAYFKSCLGRWNNNVFRALGAYNAGRDNPKYNPEYSRLVLKKKVGIDEIDDRLRPKPWYHAYYQPK